MDVTERKPESDITQEPYKGPGALVTGAGEGAITHYGTGAAGLVVGGAVSGVFAGPVNRIEEGFKKFYIDNKDSASTLKKATAHVASWPARIAEWSVKHLPMKDKVLKLVPKDRMQAVIFGGGVLGFIGFFVMPIYFMFTGAKHANDGKEQFERAKDEIRTQRAENEALRNRYVETKLELEDLKTSKAAENGTLKVAQDNPVVTTEPHSAASVAKDSPNVISAPRIEAPTIGTSLPQAPKIEGPPVGGPGPQSPIPKNQWWDGKEDLASKAVQRETPTTIEPPVIGPTGPNSQPPSQPQPPKQPWGERVLHDEAAMLAEAAR